jgi:hypothetical protein
VRHHSHFITQGNYKATCFDYRLVILRPIFLIVSQFLVHYKKNKKNRKIEFHPQIDVPTHISHLSKLILLYSARNLPETQRTI